MPRIMARPMNINSIITIIVIIIFDEFNGTKNSVVNRGNFVQDNIYIVGFYDVIKHFVLIIILLFYK